MERPRVETVSAVRHSTPNPRKGAATRAKAPRPGVAIRPSTTTATKRYKMVRTMSAFRIDVVYVSGCTTRGRPKVAATWEPSVDHGYARHSPPGRHAALWFALRYAAF